MIKRPSKAELRKRNINYTAIKINYDLSLVLPTEEAADLMKLVSKAEVFKHGYGDKNQIKDFGAFNNEYFQTKPITEERYMDLKFAGLTDTCADELPEESDE